MIFADVGDYIACPNGHRIADFAKVALEGELGTPEHYTNWHEGTSWGSPAVCPECGETGWGVRRKEWFR